jgi:hypothetical protein
MRLLIYPFLKLTISPSKVELEFMLEYIKCPSLVDYTVSKSSDIYPKILYSNHVKTSLHVHMLMK